MGADETRNTPLGAAAGPIASTMRCGHSRERSAINICWGSWNGPHAFDVPAKHHRSPALRSRAGHYSLKPHPRPPRMGVWETGEAAPARQGFDSGRISHATKSRDPNWWRTDRALANIVGARSDGRTDCGFAANHRPGALSPIMWASEIAAEGARIATQRYGSALAA